MKQNPQTLGATLVTLGRALSTRERESVRDFLRGALAWQRKLARFPVLARSAPNATPYVSIYERGVLRGCFGSHEGGPGERLARAFMLALTDPRYGKIEGDSRSHLTAEVTYPTIARPVRAEQAVAALEPGVCGVARVDDDATFLLPSVARDKSMTAMTAMQTLAAKVGAVHEHEGVIWLVGVDVVSTHGAVARAGRVAARAWLESLVDARGEVAFEMDALTGMRLTSGAMRYGRAAVAIEALTALGSHETTRARAWLTRQLAEGERGKLADWPDRPDVVLGTLALAERAGVRTSIHALANSIDVEAASPWHLAQAASVLEERTPREMWNKVMADLDARPFSPYAAMAARSMGDARTLERAEAALVDSLRRESPFVGGASITPIPETALTAAAIEALQRSSSREARAAVRRGREFLVARQILDVPASHHPSTLGAFRTSSIGVMLRCDVTAHAALAVWA